MRKIILLGLMAATIMPASAMAQSAGELRRDRQDIRQEQRELQDARRYGTRKDVHEERRDVQRAKQEYREDWRDYRRTHRDVYRAGRWTAPFRYHSWQVGVVIRPTYYSPRYYIADPYRYRLPRPAANLRWVRHYNDVLLVNIRTGRVVEVHRGFFW